MKINRQTAKTLIDAVNELITFSTNDEVYLTDKEIESINNRLTIANAHVYHVRALLKTAGLGVEQ